MMNKMPSCLVSPRYQPTPACIRPAAPVVEAADPGPAFHLYAYKPISPPKPTRPSAAPLWPIQGRARHRRGGAARGRRRLFKKRDASWMLDDGVVSWCPKKSGSSSSSGGVVGVDGDGIRHTRPTIEPASSYLGRRSGGGRGGRPPRPTHAGGG